MRVTDFDYDLPPERIAQQPLAERDSSRLLVLDRRTGEQAHHRFRDLVELLRPEDLLVFNDTRVRPARLAGRKESGGKVELLLLEKTEGSGRTGTWRCLLGTGRKPKPLSRLDLGPALEGEVLERTGDEWVVRLESKETDLETVLDRVGRMPVPPYIHRDSNQLEQLDRVRYQTVYATRPGAVAAPTAGLHFSLELLDRLRELGVGLAHLTLHVGPGTFVPVRTERLEDHRMHAERFEVPQSVATAIQRTRERKGRVVAVGTTVVRTLEASAAGGGTVTAGEGRCELFIYPGFQFEVVDAMITNFHLPRSTLLMLVSAFAGTESVLRAYRNAVASGYRFYSYGDAMLVW